MNIEEEKQSITQDDVWSDDIILKDFLTWLEENHRLGDPYQRARNNCIKLITGKGVPKNHSSHPVGGSAVAYLLLVFVLIGVVSKHRHLI